MNPKTAVEMAARERKERKINVFRGFHFGDRAELSR
jgi:hypothetical protein